MELKIKEQAEKIADEARKSISRYCFEECRAYCCRKGYLVVTDSQADLITENSRKRQELERKKTLVRMENGNYTLDLSTFNCPRLKDYKCMIHKDDARPDACKKFPLFLEGDKIRLSSRCPAIKENKLYPYIVMLINLGFSVEKNSNPYSDFDIRRGIDIIDFKKDDNNCQMPNA